MTVPDIVSPPTPRFRWFAALVALVAAAGIVLNFIALFDSTQSVAGTIWILLRYFTILTNLLIALLFGAIAYTGRAHLAPKLMGCTVLSIALVGVVYATLLSGLYQFSGGMYVADILLHRISPVLVLLYWIIWVPKGHFAFRDPLIWALYPLGYFAYAMVRGSMDGLYAYPFIDVGSLGWGQTAINAVLIAFGYFAVGAVFVWFDRRMVQAAPRGGSRTLR